METNVEVAIVGAGLAGITAADALVKAGRTVHLIEARDRVGGRTEGASFAGKAVDVGGQWVGPTQRRVLKLCERLGLATFPQYSQGKRLLEMRGRVRRYSGTIPPIPIFSMLELQRLLSGLGRLARTVDPSQPWSAARAHAFDRISAAEWLRAKLRTRAARGLMGIAVRAIYSCEPHELSLLYLLHYIAAAGSFEALAEVRGGAQQDRIAGGAFQLAQRLSAGLPPMTLLVGAPVAAVEQTSSAVRIAHAHGVTTARYAIVAMAPAMACRIAYMPAMPAARDTLCQRMPMGAVIKVYLEYERPFWRNAGLSGEAVSVDGALSPVFDASLPGESQGLLVGFLAGDHGRGLGALDDTTRRRTVIDCAVRYFGPQAAQPTAYLERNWIADEWSRGCYVGVAQNGVLTTSGASLREPVGRLHWAGTETATQWTGYMDGAIESGERAAGEVLARLNE